MADQLFDEMTRVQIGICKATSEGEVVKLRNAILTLRNRLEAEFDRLEIDNDKGWSQRAFIRHIRSCRWTLIQNFGFTDYVREYIAEAEHQDGYGYWLQFTTAQEAAEDYILYRNNYDFKEVNNVTE